MSLTPFRASDSTFRSTRCRPVLVMERKIHEGDRLAFPAGGADGGDLVVVAEVQPGDGDGGAEYLRFEGKVEVLLEHREPAQGLLRFIVGVDRRLLDHFRKSGLAESGRRSGSGVIRRCFRLHGVGPGRFGDAGCVRSGIRSRCFPERRPRRSCFLSALETNPLPRQNRRIAAARVETSLPWTPP